MAVTKYSKWIPSPLDGLSLEELLDQMSEFLLQSGFSYGFQDVSDPHRFDALRQAIIQKLVEMGRIPEELFNQWMQNPTEGASVTYGVRFHHRRGGIRRLRSRQIQPRSPSGTTQPFSCDARRTARCSRVGLRHRAG